MPPFPSAPRWFALPLLALGVAGFAAAWVLVALGSGRMAAWLAPLAALDMVLLLALARWQAGAARAGVAVLATAATIASANFCIVAAQLGETLGLRPVASALRMGPAYAWLLAGMANRPADLALYAAALVAAGWAGFSARRRAPSVR